MSVRFYRIGRGLAGKDGSYYNVTAQQLVDCCCEDVPDVPDEPDVPDVPTDPPGPGLLVSGYSIFTDEGCSVVANNPTVPCTTSYEQTEAGAVALASALWDLVLPIRFEQGPGTASCGLTEEFFPDQTWVLSESGWFIEEVLVDGELIGWQLQRFINHVSGTVVGAYFIVVVQLCET